MRCSEKCNPTCTLENILPITDALSIRACFNDRLVGLVRSTRCWVGSINIVRIYNYLSDNDSAKAMSDKDYGPCLLLEHTEKDKGELAPRSLISTR